jgi:tetratricopeptide (TPR) repeat protein
VLGGFVLVMVGRDYNAGLDAVRRAVDQNPGSGFVTAMAGCALVFGDDLEMGLALLERAMALGPLDPSFFSILTVAGCARLFSGHPDLAVELAERAVSLNPDWDSTYWVLVAAYAQLNRLPDAQAALARLVALVPGACVAKFRRTLPIRNTESLEMVLNGLRQAGLPD